MVAFKEAMDGGGSPGDRDRLDERVRSAAVFVLLLDFDGTLAGIAERPEDVLPEQEVVETLARLVLRPGTRVAVISGRSLPDLKSRLPIDGLFLAGNHGLEVDGPAIHFVHPLAAFRVEAVEALARELRVRLAGIPGVLVESKGLSVACHDRAVPPAMVQSLRREIRRVVEREPGAWRVLRGKRVVEILPSTDWTKGSCARFLLEHFEARANGNLPSFAVAVGDDRTDRDLLVEVRGRGYTIAVGDSLGTGWDLHLPGVAAVHHLLAHFDRLRSEIAGPVG